VIRKLVVVLLVAGICLLSGITVLAAEKEPVTLEFWNWWGVARAPLMNSILGDFHEKYPWITVTSVVQPWDRREEKVLTALAGGKPPEVIMSTRREVVDYAARGLIVPITKYVEERDVDLGMFYPSEISGFWWEGELYTMPMPTAGGCELIIYNKDLFKEVGLDPSRAPVTWQETNEYAKKLTILERGFIKRVGIDNSSWEMFIPYLYSNFGKFISDDGKKIVMDSPEAVETLKWMYHITNDINGGIENVADFFQATDEAVQSAFYMGFEGIAHRNVAIFFHIKELAPDMNYGVGKIPHGDRIGAESHGIAGLAFGWGYVIPKGIDPKKYEAAYLLVEWLTTEEKGGGRFMLEQGRPSPVKKFNSNPEYYEINPHWDTILQILEADISIPITPAYIEQTSYIQRGVEEAMYRRKSPEEAIEWISEECQKLLDEFWTKYEK